MKCAADRPFADPEKPRADLCSTRTLLSRCRTGAICSHDDREQQPEPAMDEDHGREGATGNGAGPVRPRQRPNLNSVSGVRWRRSGRRACGSARRSAARDAHPENSAEIWIAKQSAG